MSDTPEQNGAVLGEASLQSIAGAISKLRENPELITGIASALSGVPKKDDAQEERSADVPSFDKLPEIMSVLAPVLSGETDDFRSRKSPASQKTALLYALKPFLSSSRQDAIDTAIKISRISDLIKKLK